MPGNYVFPGGIIDPADANVKWRELFAALGYDGDSLARLIPQAATRPPIFQKQQNELPREISLRITAIRETFEESGLLMCTRRRDGDDISTWIQHLPSKGSVARKMLFLPLRASKVLSLYVSLDPRV